MKLLKLLLALLAYAFAIIIIAQEKETVSLIVKKDNLLSIQTKVLISNYEETLEDSAN
ncbi:hypothetical protein [Lacinutrix sp. Bg11-31]|uniref:hypothetical protein n=1 Tax=Lacinutrix sp. Bg11-31 TaxID=2057808 RepID=UPI0012FDCF51|nr:hypothetical protein [Lacinutrix sp. Bg11-31]